MTEAVVGALSGLAVAISGLGGVLWKMSQSNRSNGNHQSEELRLLRSIDGQLSSGLRQQIESLKTLEGHMSDISGGIEFLKGQGQ